MFVKPLAGKGRITEEQRQRLESETATIASTHNESRKESTHQDEDHDLSENEFVDVEEEVDEEFKEGTQQKFISPSEVKDHIEKTWRKEGDLLNLIYGKFEPKVKGAEFETQSLGSQIFFIQKVIVPPTRFRPESEGSMGGGGASGKAYLHTHSAMLLKILTANEAMKEALLDQNNNTIMTNPGDIQKSGKLGITTQKWIQLQEAANCFMDSSMASKTADKEQGGVR